MDVTYFLLRVGKLAGHPSRIVIDIEEKRDKLKGVMVVDGPCLRDLAAKLSEEVSSGRADRSLLDALARCLAPDLEPKTPTPKPPG